MINKKDSDAYMSIKAPASLKERILAEQTKNNHRISSKVRMCYALAAMLLVIIAVFAFLPTKNAELYYGDTTIDENAVLLTAGNPNARIAVISNVDIKDIPLTVKTDKKTEITADNGVILTLDESGEEFEYESITVDGDTAIVWRVTLTQDTQTYSLNIGKETYCISKNDEGQWTLSKKII